jgi:hypothetical protein
VSADIQYFAVSNRVYFLSNNVGIHFVFTYYFIIHPFRLVPWFSGITPKGVTMTLRLTIHLGEGGELEIYKICTYQVEK